MPIDCHACPPATPPKRPLPAQAGELAARLSPLATSLKARLTPKQGETAASWCGRCGRLDCRKTACASSRPAVASPLRPFGRGGGGRLLQASSTPAESAERQRHPASYERLLSNRNLGDPLLTAADDSSELGCCQCVGSCVPETCLNGLMGLECTEGNCVFGANGEGRCRNRRFTLASAAAAASGRQLPAEDHVEVFHTGSARGFGLRAARALTAGCLVGEYLGEVVQDVDLPTWRYAMSLQKGVALDASRAGGIVRFMNNSCAPNCYAQRWNVDGHWRIGLFALHDIHAGEELTFCYLSGAASGGSFGPRGAAEACLCGQPSCSGIIGQSRPKRQRRGGGAVPRCGARLRKRPALCAVKRPLEALLDGCEGGIASPSSPQQPQPSAEQGGAPSPVVDEEEKPGEGVEPQPKRRACENHADGLAGALTARAVAAPTKEPDACSEAVRRRREELARELSLLGRDAASGQAEDEQPEEPRFTPDAKVVKALAEQASKARRTAAKTLQSAGPAAGTLRALLLHEWPSDGDLALAEAHGLFLRRQLAHTRSAKMAELRDAARRMPQLEAFGHALADGTPCAECGQNALGQCCIFCSRPLHRACAPRLGG
eukprot:TRINITY_DN52694_c1_g1_i1.p1 TRINITY_DN52694_c1_g1~~TRINITY_DN52694_c1_g1_i1.p1  ORF type:complete len:618 (+),score=101.51 TRINITY_DN52694_c1_g1_i1:41-1855(+)